MYLYAQIWRREFLIHSLWSHRRWAGTTAPTVKGSFIWNWSASEVISKIYALSIRLLQDRSVVRFHCAITLVWFCVGRSKAVPVLQIGCSTTVSVKTGCSAAVESLHTRFLFSNILQQTTQAKELYAVSAAAFKYYSGVDNTGKRIVRYECSSFQILQQSRQHRQKGL